MLTAIQTKSVITPLEEIEEAVILVEAGIVKRVASRKDLEIPAEATIVDAKDKTVVPGFVDIHVHGGAGHDVMHPTDEALSAVSTSLFRHGTSAFYPTTVSASRTRPFGQSSFWVRPSRGLKLESFPVKIGNRSPSPWASISKGLLSARPNAGPTPPNTSRRLPRNFSTTCWMLPTNASNSSPSLRRSRERLNLSDMQDHWISRSVWVTATPLLRKRKGP